MSRICLAIAVSSFCTLLSANQQLLAANGPLEVPQLLAEARNSTIEADEKNRDQVLKQVAEAYACCGDVEEALRTVELISDAGAKDDALQTIVIYLNDGSIERAIAISSKVVDETKRDFVISAIASRCAHRGDTAKCRELISAIREQKERDRVLSVLAEQFATSGKLDDATAIVNSLDKSLRSSALGRVAAGQARGGNIPGAVATLQQLDDETRIQATLPVAIAAAKAGDRAAADQLLKAQLEALQARFNKQAVALASNANNQKLDNIPFACGALLIAGAQAEIGDVNGAATNAKMAIAKLPTGWRADFVQFMFHDLATALVKNGGTAAAIDVCSSIVDTDATALAFGEVAFALVLEGKLPEAQETKIKAVKAFSELKSDSQMRTAAQSLLQPCAALGDAETLQKLFKLLAEDYQGFSTSEKARARACQYQSQYGDPKIAMNWATECKSRTDRADCLVSIAQGITFRKEKNTSK